MQKRRKWVGDKDTRIKRRKWFGDKDTRKKMTFFLDFQEKRFFLFFKRFIVRKVFKKINKMNKSEAVVLTYNQRGSVMSGKRGESFCILVSSATDLFTY